MSKDRFAEIWGKIVLECPRCHYETREPDEKENHGFDCEYGNGIWAKKWPDLNLGETNG